MEDFYDKIKDKMSNKPEVSTDWGMWEDIESTLDKKKKRRFIPVLLGLPFLLLFAGAVGYKLAPKSEDSISSKIDIQRDTIYLTETSHSVDTIVKTKYITKWKYRNSNKNLALQSQIQDLATINASLQQSINGLDSKLNEYRYAFSESILKSNPKYKHLDYYDKKKSTNSIAQNDVSRTDRSLLTGLTLSPLLDLRELTFERQKIMVIHNLLFENLVKNKKSESLLEKLTPDYINVGASLESPALAFTKNLSPGLEFGLGLNVELMFSPKFSIVTGVRTRSTENKTIDPFVAALYPQPTINSEEEFKNLAVKSSFIDIPLTLKYDFLRLNQNNIYFTGGLLLSRHNQIEYKYEYIRDQTEIYYEEKGDKLGWSLGSSVIGIGYEMDNWNSVSAFIESYARYNFSSNGEAIHGAGFRFGVYYKI